MYVLGILSVRISSYSTFNLIVELKPDVINIEISLGLVKVHKFLNIFKWKKMTQN